MKYKIVIVTKKGNRKDIIVKNKRATNQYKKFKPIIVPMPGHNDKLRHKTHEELQVIPYQLKGNKDWMGIHHDGERKLLRNHVLNSMYYEFIDFMYSMGYRYKDATTRKLLNTKELRQRFKKADCTKIA